MEDNMIIEDDIVIDPRFSIPPKETGEPPRKLSDRQPIKVKKVRRKRCQECQQLFPPSELETHECIAIVKEPEEPEEDPEEMAEQEEHNQMEIKYGGERLFDLQLTLYMTLERGMQLTGDGALNGLSERMESMRDKYRKQYEELYIHYGDNVDEYVGPLTFWAISTASDIGTTYISNKKNK